MTDFFYWRCSTDLQDQERQILAGKQLGVSEQNIFGDKIVIGMGAGSISNWIRDLPNLL